MMESQTKNPELPVRFHVVPPTIDGLVELQEVSVGFYDEGYMLTAVIRIYTGKSIAAIFTKDVKSSPKNYDLIGEEFV